jgi:ABC-type anion transport system duplicated permease subunit
MHPLQFLVPLGPLEAVAGLVPWAVFALAVVTLGTRLLAQNRYERQAQEGDDDERLERYLPHSVAMTLLMLSSFLFAVVEPHGGVVMSVLVIGAFLADFFEFESRKVEARNELAFEQPKAAIGASMLVLGYAAFQTLFQFVAPIWNAVV